MKSVAFLRLKVRAYFLLGRIGVWLGGAGSRNDDDVVEGFGELRTDCWVSSDELDVLLGVRRRTGSELRKGPTAGRRRS